MGVKGLYGVLSTREPFKSRVMKPTDIREMAKNHRKKEGQEEAILVVDGMSIVYTLYGNIDWVCGGQWSEYENSLRAFVKAFEQIGVELVFIFDGAFEESKSSEWRKRRLEHVQEYENLLNRVKADPHMSASEIPGNQTPSGAAGFARVILRSLNCRVYQSVGEADKEVAEFAKEHPGCFAILSNDTDFLILDTKPFLSVNDFKMATMQTICFDREAFAACLTLSVPQLALFSCLMGNDVVSRDKVFPFHKSINTSRDKSVLLKRIAETIKGRKWTANSGDIQEMKQVSRLVFRSDAEWELIRDALKTYEMSTQSVVYDMVTEGNIEVPFTAAISIDQTLLNNLFQRYIRGELSSIRLMALLHRLEYKVSESLEDVSDPGLKHSAFIYADARKRIYGVLFNHLTSASSSGDIQVKEWIAYQGNDLMSPELVVPYPFKGQVIPTLEELWLDESQGTDTVKFKVFLKCLGISKEWNDMVREVEDKHILLCCLLKYLLTRGQDLVNLEKWEVDAIVAQAALLSCGEEGVLEHLVPPPPYNCRALHLGSVLMRGVGCLTLALEVCGSPLKMKATNPSFCFNGRLFHKKYICAEKGADYESELLEGRVRAIEIFQQINRIIGN